MIQAICHCGAVRFEVSEPPAWVLDCNCTVCRRYGGMWCYFPPEDQAKLLAVPDPNATATYSWQDRGLLFHHCRTCGCVTHFEAINGDRRMVYGMNARMMVGLDGANIPIRRIDNGHLGWFWTRGDEPIVPGHHPNMAPPGREWDWS